MNTKTLDTINIALESLVFGLFVVYLALWVLGVGSFRSTAVAFCLSVLASGVTWWSLRTPKAEESNER